MLNDLIDMPVNSLLNGCWEKEDYYIQKINGRDICHESWKEMKPKSRDRITKDYFEEYYNKIHKNKGLSHIPKEVSSQWLYPFNDDINSLANYAWIDFYKAYFSLEEIDVDIFISQVHPNNEGRDLVTTRARCKDFSHFCCFDEDIEYWKEQGTWRVPPVILDSSSFSNIPEWADINYPYQLIEGHNRLGYLHANYNMKNRNLKNKHQVYILKDAKI
ncbi:MAG: hypothetical protein ACLTWE_10390 [Dysgonomonas mossii]|uniref:hypothetical protein n=1 Tax=Dysgonomonas mossii TaxID=163665 RepID=UPI0039958F76